MSSNLLERRCFERAMSLVARAPAQFAGTFGCNFEGSIGLQQVAEMIVFVDADEHEPVAAILRDDDGLAQGRIAKLRKLPDKFS
jgi:hypothetical protein